MDAHMDVIRWGIIGCGDVTEVKSGPGFQKARGSQLVAVMRRNGDKARDYAQRHGVAKWTDDADEIIYDPNVDAVYIATPPHLHREQTLAAARAGNTTASRRELEARRLAPCRPVEATSPTAHRPGTLERPRASVAMPPM